MPGLPRSVIDERVASKAAEQAARDEAIVSAPARKRSGHAGRQSADIRAAAQARIDARNPPEALAPAAIPDTGGDPEFRSVAEETALARQIGQTTPRGELLAAINANAPVTTPAVPDTAPAAARRQDLARFDTADLDAQLAAIKGSRRGLSLADIREFDKLENERLDLALRGREQDDTLSLGERRLAREERATNSLIAQANNTMSNRNIDDATKQTLNFYVGVLSDPVQRSSLPEGVDPYTEIVGILNSLDEAELSRRTNGNKFADGGEVPTPDIEGAISEAPVSLDSGDYIIPVEAMRFYGRKFFQDLINKAEDVE